MTEESATEPPNFSLVVTVGLLDAVDAKDSRAKNTNNLSILRVKRTGFHGKRTSPRNPPNKYFRMIYALDRASFKHLGLAKE